MEILKELFFGNIAEVSRRDIKLNFLREKELELYEVVKEKLPEGNKELLDEFLDKFNKTYDEELTDKYIQGFKTGVLIGIEVNNIEL